MGRRSRRSRGTPARACNGKHRHETRKAAQAHIRSLVVKRGALPWTYESYHCRTCDGWHVGHAKRRRR